MKNSQPQNVFFLECVVLLSITFASRAQTTIHVPADAATIQSAIDAAKNGDTVFVSPGTYNENIDFHGKAITVTSGAKSFTDIAATSTIINGTSDGPVANFATGETSGAVLNGFVLTGGHTSIGSTLPGGGVLVDHSSPTIQNNVIANNSGCGVLVVNQASPLIEGNDVKSSLYTDTENLYPCTAADGGGNPGVGIVLYNANSPSIIGNVIEDNAYSVADSANQDTTGAGIFISGTNTVLIQNNIIRNNFSNESAAIAGQIGNMAQHLVLVQNLIYGNSSDELQVFLSGSYGDSRPTLTETNNTIVGGGEDVALYFGPSTITNNIIYTPASLNAGVGGLFCAFLPENSSSAVAIQNNDLLDPNLVPTEYPCTLGAGNLQTAPSFVNLEGSDFHETPSSITVGAGLISAPSVPASDLDGKNRTVCGTIDMGVYEVHPQPPIALSVSPDPAPGQSSVTLTATVTGNCNIPTGPITFSDGSTILGTATLDGSAVATFSTSFLFVGTHILTATYPGDFNFDSSTSNAITEVITGPPTTTVLNSITPNPALPFQPITMTATVGSAYTIPAGTVTFMAAGKVLATASVAANGTASAAISTLGAGTYPVTAVYGGSTEYAGSTSNTIVEVVGTLPTTTTVAVSPNPSTYGQPVVLSTHVAPVTPNKLVPTGMVQLTFCRGATINLTLDANGNSSIIQPTGHEIAEPVSSCSFTGQYYGDNAFAPSTSTLVTDVVTPSPSTTILSASPNPAYFSQPVIVTVQIAGTPSPTANPVTGNPIPPGALQFSGTVQLFDAGVLIASAPVTATQAIFSLSTLAVGSHTLTATYSNDPNLGSSTSLPITEVITPAPPADFSLTGTNITFKALHAGTGDLELASLNSFAGNVALTCSPPFPPNYACTLQFSSITLTPGLSSILTYTLSPTFTASSQPSHRSTRIVLAALFPLSFFCLVGLARRRRTLISTLLSLTLLATLATATTACGPDHFIPITTGTFPITFTATGATQGTTNPITHTLTINATITP